MWIPWSGGKPKPAELYNKKLEVISLYELVGPKTENEKHLHPHCWTWAEGWRPILAYRVIEEPAREMTLVEIETELGYKVKLIDERI